MSVSVSKTTPSAWSSLFSSRKFSMMPLWTTASRFVAWGWAFVSLARPCVAHRVWPMPMAPESGDRRSLSCRLTSLPRRAAARAAPHRASPRPPSHSPGIRDAAAPPPPTPPPSGADDPMIPHITRSSRSPARPRQDDEPASCRAGSMTRGNARRIIRFMASQNG